MQGIQVKFKSQIMLVRQKNIAIIIFCTGLLPEPCEGFQPAQGCFSSTCLPKQGINSPLKSTSSDAKMPSGILK